MKVAFTLKTIKKQLGLSFLLLGAGISSQAQSTLIAGWHFNSYVSESTVNADYGTGTIYLDGTQGSSSWSGSSNFAGSTLNMDEFPASPGAGASLSLVGNANNGKAIVIKFSMTGYADLDVSFATRGTSTGFNSGSWAYSTDGTNWTGLPDNTATTSTSFSVKTVATITGLSNAATAYLRYTLNGAGSASGNNRIDNLTLMGSGTPLAIILGNITAANKGNENVIRWNSLTEDIGDAFILEHSNNGADFKQIYQVNAKGMPGAYTYTDQQPYEGANYYRLYLVNNDGVRTYSKTVNADVKGNGFAINAYPNPATDEVTVNISGATQGRITLTDVNGRVVNTTAVNAGTVKLATKGLQPGFYILRFDDGQHTQTLKINKK